MYMIWSRTDTNINFCASLVDSFSTMKSIILVFEIPLALLPYADDATLDHKRCARPMVENGI